MSEQNGDRSDIERGSRAPAAGPASRATGVVKYDPLDAFLREIQKYPLLGPEDEKALAEQYVATGDVQAAARLVTSNLRLVVKIAFEYRRAYRNIMDLVQEGNIGLMKAVDRYDVRKGFRFSTYATWWVRHAIGRAIAEKERLVRLPVYAIEQRRAARRALSSFEAEHGREPTDAEILAEIGLAGDAVAAARSWASDTVVSLDRPVGDEEGGRRFVDQLVDEHAPDPFEEVCCTQWRSEIRQLLEYLPAVERFVLERHFGLDGGEGETLKGVGNLMGRSRERARQIAAQAMGHLRPKVKRLR